MTAAAARLALAFGVFLALAEAVRNWGDWQWWPFWLVDYIAAALLIAGWALVRGGNPRGVQVLAGAWGFTTAMFYMSFWSHIASFDEPADGNISQGPLTVIIGALWIVTVIGFVMSLLSARRDSG